MAAQPATAKNPDYLKISNTYCRSVVSGRQDANRWIKLSCNRHLNDLKRAKTKQYPYKYDPVKARRAINFIQKMHHVKGRWAKKKEKVKLEPWQVFIIASIFGWVHKETGYRKYTEATILIPRKNGKSMLATCISLYMLCADNEPGAEIYAGATSEKQALLVFNPARQICLQNQQLVSKYGITIGAKNLSIPFQGSKFETLIGDPPDGTNPSCAIIDEYHEHKKAAAVETMLTGMGSREQPLLLIITTAGENTDGPCHKEVEFCQSVLLGTFADDNEHKFIMMYGVDEQDYEFNGKEYKADKLLPDNPENYHPEWPELLKTLIKANPNFGISVKAEYLEKQLKKAINSVGWQTTYKIKHLNVWVNARDPWMNMMQWKALGEDISIYDFKGEQCWLGVDLASKLDIAAVSLVFKRTIENVIHYYLFGRYYIPQSATEGDDKRHMQELAASGDLIETDGNVTDYSLIRQDICDDTEMFDVQMIGSDQHQAEDMRQQINAETGVEMIEIPQHAKHMSEPMKWMEAFVVDKRIHHDNNKALEWMMSNVRVLRRADETILPRKDSDDKKIDGVVSAIMALKVAMAGEEPKTSIYEERGLLDFDDDD